MQNLKARIQYGVLPAMATPLDADGANVNSLVVEQLVEFLVRAGVKGLFVGGSTGEGILLDPGQRKKLHEAAIKAINGRIPSLIHVGTNTTAGSIDLARHAESIGADAIVAVTPYFYGIHDDALLAHYQAISAAAPNTPLFAYDIPQMAINTISPSLLERLADDIPTFTGLKSSQPDAQKVRQLLDTAQDDCIVLAGNERVSLGLLGLGADGLISGLSTAIPEPFVAMSKAFASGDFGEARRQQRLINQLLDLMPGGMRIGAIKALLSDRGIPVGPPVPPRSMPSWLNGLWNEMAAVLEANNS